MQSICRETEAKKILNISHSRFVTDSPTKEKIEKLINKGNIDPSRLCQIPLGKKPRLYGSLQKIKHSSFYLFQALILDPNHLIYDKEKFAKLKDMTCLFSGIDCLKK